jgi:hypothetical protein
MSTLASQGHLRAAAEYFINNTGRLHDADATRQIRVATAPTRPKPLRQLSGLRPDTQWPLLGANLSFLDNRILEFYHLFFVFL